MVNKRVGPKHATVQAHGAPVSGSSGSATAMRKSQCAGLELAAGQAHAHLPLQRARQLGSPHICGVRVRLINGQSTCGHLYTFTCICVDLQNCKSTDGHTYLSTCLHVHLSVDIHIHMPTDLDF